ncbi:MAG: hypothetical protein Q8K05_00080 [Polaromonas sp.]|jgi:hypothetical protein|uniref:hypothetical protein n=1 Tax=Polaromonas sp. TaxID=1869339 RepID=UPI00273027AD|nr:hypothetical protein [Polaromonas sp.]MDP2254448.1 hypothetical protein [Polaromonas sp.]MDP3708070.1 hypothetical protein [Polaromonas sp.]
MRRNTTPRQVARTVLLVGEGDAELQFMQHLKGLYVQRSSGVVVTIKNARGKGAAHVVDFAFRQSRNAAYDVKAALLDTDTDWNDKTRAVARKAKIHVMPCQPCLEAVLLQLHRAPVQGRMTAQLKQDFSARFGAAASDAAVLRHFSRDVLDEARSRIAVLDELLNLLTMAVLKT